MPTWNEWKNWLFGTPQRTMVVVAVCLTAVALLTPGLVPGLAERFETEVLAPLFRICLFGGLIILAFRYILGLGPKKKR